MRPGGRGSVLLLTLWAVVALTTAVIALATRLSLQLKWAGRLQESRQAWYLAWTGLNAAAQELSVDPEPAWDAPKEPWGQVPDQPVSFQQGRFTYRIRDQQARIPLNSAPEELLAGLPGFNLQAAQEAVLRRKEGRPIRHPAELLFLPGFQEEALDSLLPLVSLEGAGAVNLNTAPLQVLTQLGLSPQISGQVVEFRAGPDGKWGTPDDGAFPDPEQILPLLDGRYGPLLPEDVLRLQSLISGQMIGVRSSLFEVEVEGWASGHGLHKRVLAVVERGAAGAKPFIRGWHEE